MMKKFFTAIAFAILLVVLSAPSAYSKVFTYLNTTVYYKDKEDLKTIMHGVDLGMFWFEAKRKQAGIPISHNDVQKSYLNIVVTKMSKDMQDHVAYFDKRFIYIRSKKDKKKTLFGISISDNELYMSIVAHEVAHALNFQHIKGGYGFHITEAGGNEYMAYVCFFDMLDLDLRNKILLKYKDFKPFDNDWNINYIIYSMDTQNFAIASYKHFKANGPSVLYSILKGEFRVPITELIKDLPEEIKKSINIQEPK